MDGDGKAAKGKNLVVVESPAKAKTINRYLGNDYIVKASMGHVRDLPAKELGVDVEHGFAPSYEPLDGRRKVLAELKKLAKSAPHVFLATDLDREGEAIAWHLAESLHVPAGRISRVLFNEITAAAIREAFANPRQIEMNKVNAQQARRILDRIVGYKVSPLLWKKVSPGLSAGRVQSVAVRLIVDREREIDAFMPEEYWKVAAVFTTQLASAPDFARRWKAFLDQRDPDGNAPARDAQQEMLTQLSAFRAELSQWQGKKFDASAEAAAVEVAKALGLTVDMAQRTEDPAGKGPTKNRVTILGRVECGTPQVPAYVVRNVAQRDSTSRPPAPFTTAALQQAASVQLRFGAQRTMRIAQQLYEGIDVPGEGSVGLITYMRTDSTHVSAEALTQVRQLIGQEFGPSYVPDRPNFYAAAERAQEAHEAIRPTSVTRKPRDLVGALTEEQYKLYDLIWKRFVACQMASAIWKVTEAEIVAQTAVGEAVFKAMGRQLGFDGFLRVAGLPKTGDQLLPALAAQQTVAPLAIDPSQHFTQPPPRFTEASLVKALEADGIGRPSTYATIIQTVQDRGYVLLEERVFRPTDLGTVVTDKLVKHFGGIFDVRFTAHMEDQLDRVEDNTADWVVVLRDFYGPFDADLQKAASEMVHAKAETQPSDYKCETCGKPMVYRFSKNGRYLACSGYPDCKSTSNVDADGKKLSVVEVDVACPVCGKKMMLRRSRFGEFLSCSAYPDCQGALKLDRVGNVKPPTAPPLAVDVPCPKCQTPLLLRRSKRGPWLGCAKYPKCRGRAAWTSMDEAKRKQLEQLLDEHEKAHPQPQLKKMDGTPITGLYNPVTGQMLDAAASAGPREAGVNCPNCGEPMVIRIGKRGEFLACSGFPRCRNAMNLDKLEELKTQQAENPVAPKAAKPAKKPGKPKAE